MPTVDTVDLASGVKRRIPFVGSNLIMDVRRLVAPVPQGKHHVAFDTTRPLRCLGYFSCSNTISPVGIHSHAALATEATSESTHEGASNTDGRSIVPSLNTGFETKMTEVIERAS